MKTSDYRGILYNFANEYWQKIADLIPGINYAIDRQAIVDAVLLGHGEVAYAPLQRNIYNYEDVEDYEYDPEKAARVFEAAGCTKDAPARLLVQRWTTHWFYHQCFLDCIRCVSIWHRSRHSRLTGSGTGCKSKCSGRRH